MVFLKLFIAFLTIVSGLVCLTKASGLIYGNELNHKNTLIIIGTVLISFGLAVLFYTVIIITI